MNKARETDAGATQRHLPVFLLSGLRPFDGKRLPGEIVAGITLAALAIPEVMGYTSIAGMPVITGLYTILIPVVLFALLGSSRHLVVGADSATAAIMAASLAGLAATASPDYVGLAGVMAIITGAYLLIARVLRLGFLADFLSRTVLIGFLTGVGIQVACGEFSGLFGIPKRGGNPVAQVINTLKDFEKVNWPTVVISAAVLLIIFLGGKLLHRVPWALIAVIGAIVASAVLDLSADGVATLGSVPSGLPHLALPSISAGDWMSLFVTSFSLFVVILAQSAATSRAYAAKFNDEFDENVDLVGLSIANVGAGVTGAFVVNGSPTKTAMVDNAGGRSQLSQLTMAAVVLIVLLFLTKPLSYMPASVLSSVVFLIGVELVDVRGMNDILHRRPVEFAVALITAVTVVFVGVEQGILLAMLLSVIAHLRHSYRPYSKLLVPTGKGGWGTRPLKSHEEAAEGLLVYRFGAGLYYANAARFAEDVREIVSATPRRVRWLCLEAGSIQDIDYSGSAVLESVIAELRQQGVTFVLCDVSDPIVAELRRDSLLATVGEDHLYADAHDVLEAYRRCVAERAASSREQ